MNYGISFGWWEGIPLWVVGLVLLGLLVVLAKTRGWGGRLGLFLMIVGGAGNLILRIRYGGVVDNLKFFGLIYNNVWDYLVVMGLGVYLWGTFFKRK